MRHAAPQKSCPTVEIRSTNLNHADVSAALSTETAT